MYVITADQVGSRREADRVPEVLTLLAGLRPARANPFERTAGDEIQGVTTDPADVLAVVGSLVRAERWRVGIGIGPVDLPLPDSPRAGRGPAFIAARTAVREAHPSPGQLAVRMGTTPGLDSSSREVRERHTRYAESALLLYARLLRARTPEGWEVTDLLAAGASQKEAAAHLGISASAVSQRVRRSGWFEQAGAEALVCHHLSVADDRTDQ